MEHAPVFWIQIYDIYEQVQKGYTFWTDSYIITSLSQKVVCSWHLGTISYKLGTSLS